MRLTITHVDAFAEKPFSGNPAAVCVLPDPRDACWMQNVAREMNLSETAFLQIRPDGYDLRWFTPKLEVDLCGHATLASAHVLWGDGFLPVDDPARFYTRSGLLTATREGKWIELDFPAVPEEPADPPADILSALGVRALYVGKNRFDYLVEVESEAALRLLEPDFVRLRAVPARGVIVTSRADSSDADFVSRFFAPRSGIDEDPVTGSAHCCLGPFWGRRLGKLDLVGYQASARGGSVRVRLRGERVLLGGQAITVSRGELLV